MKVDKLIILDFEATCEAGGAPQPQEIIEFPSILLSLRERDILSTFSSFVRPVHHPKLSPFCKELTGIRQEEVDAAPTFQEVLKQHLLWLESCELDASSAFVTCGDWDFNSMFPVQCAVSGISIGDLPAMYRRWINIKTTFEQTLRKKAFGMASMLKSLNLTLDGRHHRGIDDCHNIAKMVFDLAARGANFQITSVLPPSRYPELSIELHWNGQVQSVVLKKRLLQTLLGLASQTFRTKITRVLTPEGHEITDEKLIELRPGVVLHVSH